MPRTPTFVRLSLEEVKAIRVTPEAFFAGLDSHTHLMIEDLEVRSIDDIPEEWRAVAHRIRIHGKAVQDTTGGPQEETDRV